MNEQGVKNAFERYLIAVEKGVPSTLSASASEVNMEAANSDKPQSKAPHSAFAERFLSDAGNAEARMRFEPALRYLQNEHRGYFRAVRDRALNPGKREVLEAVNAQSKHPYVKPYEESAPNDAGSVKRASVADKNRLALRNHELKKARWKSLKAEAPGWLERYEGARSVVAMFVLRWFGDANFSVELDPDDDPASSKIRDAAVDREARQAEQRANARHERYESFLLFRMENPSLDKSGAVREHAKRILRAPSSVWEDIRWCEKAEDPYGRPVPERLRYRREDGAA